MTQRKRRFWIVRDLRDIYGPFVYRSLRAARKAAKSMHSRSGLIIEECTATEVERVRR